jgi:exopolysaccharide production protein ExoY
MLPLKSSSQACKAKAIGQPLPLWKRSMDLGLCAVALPLLALGTFAVAVLMTVASPGPIFFRQERVGYRGRRFKLYKFRTMHVGAETSGHKAYFASLTTSNRPMQKLDARGDKRLIPCGWLIRALGLDELPQIINVMKGEMSVIGPRPCIPYEYESYSAQQRKRFEAVPGLTGLWQVSGKNRTTFEQMVAFDIKYSQEKSVSLDLKILVLTPVTIFGQVTEMISARRNQPKPVAHSMALPKTELISEKQPESVVRR